MGATIDKIQAEITLNDNGFLDAIDRVNKRTSTYTKGADTAKTGNEALAGSFRSVAQGIAVVDGPFGGIASRVSSTASLLSGTTLAVVGFGAAISAAGLIMAKAVSAGEQMERQLYKQEAVLKATGYAAGWNAEQLDDMARQTAYATLASVNDIREAQNVMMTFKSVQGDIYKEAVELTQDLAVVMGGTASSNAKMLGKALEDPVAGISAMSRAGVSFTQSQKDMITSMVDAGEKAAAQKLILAELQKQVGGVGSGEASGLSGSIDTLGQNFETLLENINETTGASKGFKFMVDALAFSINGISDAVEDDSLSVKLAKAFEERREALVAFNNATNKEEELRAAIRLQKASKNLDALIALQKKGDAKSLADYKTSQATQKRLEQEAADERRRIRESAGAKSLESIDKELASEEQKITDAHIAQLNQVESLALSEEEVKRRGYESLAELRLDYRLMLEDEYSKDINAVHAKLAAEQIAKEEAARRDQEREERAAERAETARQSEIEKSTEYFQTIDDQYNQAFLSATENEELRYQATQERLERERQTLIEQNAWTAENQSAHQKSTENAKKIHEKNLTTIQKAEQEARINAQRDFANIFVGMANSQNKTLAAIGKAAAIYNIGLATYEGAIKAYNALAGIPYVGPFLGAAAAGAVIAYGAEQMAAVKNQTYHTGGIAGQDSDNYGAKLKSGEINATLMTGEEVLTADDPRHRNNLGTVYESGSMATSATSTSVTNQITIYIDGSNSSDEALAETVAQQVTQKLSQFVSSSSFQTATVGAVSSYAKRNSGRIPGIRT